MILLLFIVLGTMFISSSVKNLLTVTSALENYFKMAGIYDYHAGSISDGRDYADIDRALKELQNIEKYKSEINFNITKSENFKINGEMVELPIVIICSAFENRIYTYYTLDNKELEEVKEGEIYIPSALGEKWNTEIGDCITINMEGLEKEFRVSGFFKDALLGSEFVSSKRVILNRKDFDYFYKKQAIIPYTGEIANIVSNDVEALNKEFAQLDPSYRVNFNIPQQLIANAYVMDVLTTIILMVFSLFIVLIAMTILNFIIRFSVEEEYREIGVMKAIGIPQNKTRWIYVTKYVGISVLGSFVGWIFSIPFGNILIQSSAENIVIYVTENEWINLMAALVVCIMIILFSYRCTGRMKKYTPMDAIRNGETGERYSKKGMLHIGHTKLPNSFFMAFNDLLSNPKRYAIILASFTLSLLLIVVLENSANTLQSGKIVKMLGVQESDLYLSTDVADLGKIMKKDGQTYLKNRIKEIEKELNALGIPCKVFVEAWLNSKLEYEDNKMVTTGLYGIGTDVEEYEFLEGSMPKFENEIAVTKMNAKRLGIEVGDTIRCDGKECIVTGTFDCFNNLGNTIRYAQDYSKSFDESIGITDVQIKFLNEPNEEMREHYKEKIEQLYPNTTINQVEGYIKKTMGDTVLIVEQLKNMAILIVIAVCVLTVMLMERSFISKEKNEIALLKAVGFQTQMLTLWHSLRILLLMVVATVITIVLGETITKLFIDPIFLFMGTTQIEYVMNPIENYVLYPIILVAVTVIADWIMAQYMRKISAADTSNIE